VDTRDESVTLRPDRWRSRTLRHPRCVLQHPWAPAAATLFTTLSVPSGNKPGRRLGREAGAETRPSARERAASRSRFGGSRRRSYLGDPQGLGMRDAGGLVEHAIGGPSFTPRAFAAASAALVRSPVRPASNSDTAAIIVRKSECGHPGAAHVRRRGVEVPHLPARREGVHRKALALSRPFIERPIGYWRGSPGRASAALARIAGPAKPGFSIRRQRMHPA